MHGEMGKVMEREMRIACKDTQASLQSNSYMGKRSKVQVINIDYRKLFHYRTVGIIAIIVFIHGPANGSRTCYSKAKVEKCY